MRPAWPERGVRWVKAENIHLTLRFLGNTEEERVGRIGKGLTVVAQEHEAFELALAGSGCFPNGWRPRVIWTSIADDAGRLVALHSDIEGVVRELGYEAEMRDYRPHLTLGRVRQGVKPPQGDWYGDPSEMAFEVGEVELIESALKSGRAEYRTRSTALLRSRGV